MIINWWRFSYLHDLMCLGSLNSFKSWMIWISGKNTYLIIASAGLTTQHTNKANDTIPSAIWNHTLLAASSLEPAAHHFTFECSRRDTMNRNSYTNSATEFVTILYIVYLWNKSCRYNGACSIPFCKASIKVFHSSVNFVSNWSHIIYSYPWNIKSFLS